MVQDDTILKMSNIVKEFSGVRALSGVNIEATVDLARRVDIPVIASGGVKGLDDIHILALHAADGIEGVITGRALYEGKLDLAAAIAIGDRAENAA